MNEVNKLYGKYLSDRTKLESDYNKLVQKMKAEKLEKCPLKEGMLVKFHSWIGRIIYVDFVGIFEDQRIQVMLMDSETITKIQINENEFDKVESLEEPEGINKVFINEAVERLEGEKLNYRIALNTVKNEHGIAMANIEKDLDILRKDCVHDWKLKGLEEVRGYVHKCTICSKEKVIGHQ